MPRRVIQRAADAHDVGLHARRRLVVGGEHRLDLLRLVRIRRLLDGRKRRALPQGVSMICTFSPWRWQRSIQRWLNMPNLAASTVSPGESVLLIAASQPPVPVEGITMTSP